MIAITTAVQTTLQTAVQIAIATYAGAFAAAPRHVLDKPTIDSLPVNPNAGYVYGIYVDGKLMYVGKSSSKGLKNRLTQHSEGAAPAVYTQHANVTAARNAGKKVEFVVLEIFPNTFNSTIETELIEELNPLWNKRDC